MKYILLFLSMAFFAIDNCLAQDTIKHFIAFDGETKCKPSQGFYYRVAIKEDVWWHVKDYYCNTKSLYRDGIYKEIVNDSFRNEQGMFLVYHPNKTVMKKARYINGLEEGLVKEYDSAGILIDSAFYKKGILCKARYKWDNGAIVFKGLYDEHGSGIGEEWEYYADGKLYSNGKTSNGCKKDSVWTFYHQNGQISSIENYKSDSLLSIACFDEKGGIIDSCKIDIMPQSLQNVSEFLGQNLMYPDKARERNKEGAVLVIYWIDTDGSVIHPFTLKMGLGVGLEEEAIRVVSLMPKWKPGTHRGKPVRVLYTLPVWFRLD